MDTSITVDHSEGLLMTSDAREIKRKLRILNHAEETGNVAKTCRYFGIPRSLFYVWRNAYRACG